MNSSDTMGNMGAFITLNGKDMVPKFTTYDAVVCLHVYFILVEREMCDCFFPAPPECKTNGLRQFFTKFDVLVFAHMIL